MQHLINANNSYIKTECLCALQWQYYFPVTLAPALWQWTMILVIILGVSKYNKYYYIIMITNIERPINLPPFMALVIPDHIICHCLFLFVLVLFLYSGESNCGLRQVIAAIRSMQRVWMVSFCIRPTQVKEIIIAL